MGFYRGPKISREGLVLLLDAANPKSYVSGDTSWYSLVDKTVSTSYGSPSFSSDYLGEFNLSGAGDYFRVPQTSGQFSQSTCSYEIWCYPTLFPTNGHLLFMDRPNFDDAYGIQVFNYTTSGYISVRGSGSDLITTSGSLNLNEWNHVVVTFSGTTAEVYINTVFQTGLASINEVQPSTYDLYIGKYPTVTNTLDWNGKIASAKVYNRLLTSDEVTQLYSSSKTRFGL